MSCRDLHCFLFLLHPILTPHYPFSPAPEGLSLPSLPRDFHGSWLVPRYFDMWIKTCFSCCSYKSNRAEPKQAVAIRQSHSILSKPFKSHADIIVIVMHTVPYTQIDKLFGGKNLGHSVGSFPTWNRWFIHVVSVTPTTTITTTTRKWIFVAYLTGKKDMHTQLVRVFLHSVLLKHIVLHTHQYTNTQGTPDHVLPSETGTYTTKKYIFLYLLDIMLHRVALVSDLFPKHWLYLAVVILWWRGLLRVKDKSILKLINRNVQKELS